MPRGRGRGKSRANNSRRCTIHNLFLASDGTCGRCVTEVQPTDRDVELDDVVIPPIPPDAPIGVEIAEVGTTFVETCEKCSRTASDNYRLDFQILHRDSLHNTMFGKHVAGMIGETVNLCQHCLAYNNNTTTRHKDWPNAWPSVMHTLLFDTHRFNSNAEKLFKLLPHEIKESFKQNKNTVHPLIATSVTESVFKNITSEKKFWNLINNRTAKTLVKASNTHCFPNIRCPAGCFEFVEKKGISFAHFLNWLYPNFTSFSANSRKFLKGAREDIMKTFTLLDKFTVSPCVINNEKGLQLVTCLNLKNGVLLNYVHVPTNPVAGNVSPRFVDRLALMVSSVRTVRPLKKGTKSATFTMCRVDSGRISGVSSTVLHHSRNFESPSNDLRLNMETLMINCRTDVKEVIRMCCKNQELFPNVAEHYLALKSPVSLSVIEENSKTATVFNMNSLMRMKDFVEKIGDDVSTHDDFKKPLVYGHKMDGYGFEPVIFPTFICQDSSLFFFSYPFLYIDALWSMLCNISENNSQLNEICKVLQFSYSHNCFPQSLL